MSGLRVGGCARGEGGGGGCAGGGVSGKRPGGGRSTEGYLSPRQGPRKGPRIHPSRPCLYNNYRQGSVERQGWSGGGGDPLQMSFSPDVPPSHTWRGEREGVPGGQAVFR